MGFEWHPSLHQLFDKVTGPLHDLFKSGQAGAGQHHILLWECYLSGQMTAADLEREVAADPDFADYVEGQERRHRRH